MSAIRPGTLCVIEPPQHEELHEVREQLSGLVVVAVRPYGVPFPADWEVKPAPAFTAQQPFTARGLTYSPGTYDVCGIPEPWLRPIRGERVPVAEREGIAA